MDSKFDFILFGTNLTTSILAAALSASGKSVLHLDSLTSYGHQGIVVNFRTLISHAFFNDSDDLKHAGFSEFNVTVHPHIPTKATEERITPTDLRTELINHYKSNSIDSRIADKLLSTPVLEFLESSENAVSTLHSLTGCLATSRQFNLELIPIPLFSNGDIINLLISSGCGKYLEFKALEDMYIVNASGVLEHVPGSKEDVFSNSNITLLEKRILMKVLTFAATFEEDLESWKEFEGKPYAEFLKSQRVPERLIPVIIHSIAMAGPGESLTTEEGLKLTKEHLSSIGRFGGKSMFLCCIYGALSELSQAFCRMAAVNGATYMLGLQPSSIETTDIVTVHTTEGSFTADKFIASHDYFAKLYPQDEFEVKEMSHAIIITDSPLNTMGTLQFMVIPPLVKENKETVYVYQLSVDTGSTPGDKYVVYFFTAHDANPKHDLEKSVQALINVEDSVDENKPNAIISTYYKRTLKTPKKLENSGGNLVVLEDLVDPMKVDECVDTVFEIFKTVTGNTDFFFPEPVLEED